MKERTAKLQMLTAMGIFGTVGIFVRMIPLGSATIAFSRGILGALFLLVFLLLTGRRPSLKDIGKNALVLCVSGIAIGCNWILLFEAYRYTTVATATVCYYMAPVLVMLASPLLGERLTVKKLLCAAAALVGVFLVSGMVGRAFPTAEEFLGILFGLGAAVLYASVMLLNKKLGRVSSYDRTLVQLFVAGAAVLPYLLLKGGLSFSEMDVKGWAVLLVVGIVHTGLAYVLYFGSMKELKAQTTALFSYLDPVVAIVLSALLLQEPMDVWMVLGAVLILGSSLVSELPVRKRI